MWHVRVSLHQSESCHVSMRFWQDQSLDIFANRKILFRIQLVSILLLNRDSSRLRLRKDDQNGRLGSCLIYDLLVYQSLTSIRLRWQACSIFSHSPLPRLLSLIWNCGRSSDGCCSLLLRFFVRRVLVKVDFYTEWLWIIYLLTLFRLFRSSDSLHDSLEDLIHLRKLFSISLLSA